MIRSTPHSLTTDREIYHEVRSDLYLSSSVDSSDVSIKIDDSVVTLTGKVNSSCEYEAARETAFEG
jgi:osmotically-inducible protein OsmY